MVYTYTQNYKGKYWTDAPIALIPGGSIRASIDHKDKKISKADLISVLPFEDNIIKVSVPGTKLLEMLEHSVSNHNPLNPPGEYLQVSGLRVVYDIRNPVGQRVIKAKARCWKCKIPEYFDVDSLGNHEFDNEVSGLTPFIENLTSPVLAANLILDKVPELERQTNLKKSITFDISGTKVGVIGYLTPETKILAKKNDVEYIDEIVAIKEEVGNIQNQGIKIIIALGHSGYLKDLQIAKEVEGLDLVIGGHSNTFLWNGTSPDVEEIQGPYPTYVKQESGRSVLVVQAYAYTKYLGKLHLLFNSNGEIMSADGLPILLDKSIPQDPEVLAIVQRYKENVNKQIEYEIGTTSVVLDGLSCRLKECNLGNLIADAIFYTYTQNYKGKYWTDAPIALIPGGSIRASIDHKDKKISEADLISVLPFEDNIIKVSVPGTKLLEMLEHSVSNHNPLNPPGEYLQVSGLRVVYDIRNPVGQRVVKAKARCWKCKIPEYFDVDVNENYNVLMPIFLAKGGSGFQMLVGQPSETKTYDELFCTENYIRQHSPVFPEVEGRIIILSDETSTHPTHCHHH